MGGMDKEKQKGLQVIRLQMSMVIKRLYGVLPVGAFLLPNITTTLRDIRLLSLTLLSYFPDEKTETY